MAPARLVGGLDAELHGRDRRLAARLRYARFPYRRSVEDFDFEFQPSVDRKLVGPAYKEVAAKYKGDDSAEAKLIDKVKKALSHRRG